MASVDDGSDVLISPVPGISSNYGSPGGSRPDLDGMGDRSIDAQFKELRHILLPPARGFADFDKQVKSICEAAGIVTSRITSVEQIVNALPVLMARESDSISVSCFLFEYGSPNGSLPELDGTGYRAIKMEEQINEIYSQLPLFLQKNVQDRTLRPDAFSNSGRPDD